MGYAEAVISGIVQGVTEFLPISSSGHLVMLHHYFGYREPQIFFDIFLHLGTLFAVLAYFWYDIIKVVTKERRLLGMVIAGSVPTAAIGLIFKDIFEALFTDIKAVGFMLIVTAGFLFLGQRALKSRGRKKSDDGRLDWIKAVVIGLIQGISIIPGISRSGSTISTGLLLRLDRREAVRFSFLLSIPAVIGALLFKLADAGGGATIITLPMLSGAISAFAVGLGAIYILIRIVYAERLNIFGIYCLLAGSAVLLS